MFPEPDLDRLLNRWTDVPPPPERLSAEVWQRIAESEELAKPGPLARLHEVFTRPSFVATFVAACTLLGLFLAELRRSHIAAEHNEQLVRSYLQLIDPLLQTASLDEKTPPPQS